MILRRDQCYKFDWPVNAINALNTIYQESLAFRSVASRDYHKSSLPQATTHLRCTFPLTASSGWNKRLPEDRPFPMVVSMIFQNNLNLEPCVFYNSLIACYRFEKWYINFQTLFDAIISPFPSKVCVFNAEAHRVTLLVSGESLQVGEETSRLFPYCFL